MEAKAKQVERKLMREISQSQIRDYDNHRRQVATLKRALKDEEEITDSLERAYVTMLERGFKCEAGDLRLSLDVTSRSVTPKYKELFASVAGPKAVEAAQRDAGMKEFKHVSVQDATVKVGA